MGIQQIGRLCATRPNRALLTLLVVLAMSLTDLAGQSVEFRDGKSIPMGSESDFIRIEELVRDKNWLAAAKQAALTIESSGNKLFLLDQSNGCRTFASGVTRTQTMLCKWSELAPEALEAYRELIDSEAQVLYRKALTEGSVSKLKSVANRYFASRWGDKAVDQLARIEFEEGHFQNAAQLWGTLIRDTEFPNNTPFRHPDSDLEQKNLMAQVLGANLLGKQIDLAGRQKSYLSKRFAGESFRFLGSEVANEDELQSRFQSEAGDWLSPEIVPAKNEWLDIRGKANWSFPTNFVFKSHPNNQIDAGAPDLRKRDLALHSSTAGRSSAEHMAASAANPASHFSILPTIHGDSIYWCDEHHVFQKKRGESDSAQKSLDDLTLWSTPFRRETPGGGRRRIGKAEFELSIDEGFLFARMGDPRTSYRNDEVTRNRSYLVGLDLKREGSLLPGFPLENSDPRVEFDATPVHHEGHLFVATRKSFRDNSNNQITLRCLELSYSNRARNLKTIWQKSILAGDSNNRGIWDEISRTRLLYSEGRLIYAGLGFVVALDARNGEVLWITDYFRDRYSYAAGSDGPLATVDLRTSEQMLLSGGKLFLAPTDSREIFCFDLAWGKCLWHAPFPEVSHLLAATDESLIAGGRHLLWIENQSGRLQARFPARAPETGRRYGTDPSRGIGRGWVDQGIVYWPTLNKIFVLSTHLKSDHWPRQFHAIDLPMRKTTGGNLCVDDGIMLIVNDRHIKAFVD